MSERWPNTPSEGIRPYFNRREELRLENGVIVWGYRLVIPENLRKDMLNELHSHHFGIVKTKAMARSYIYWPKIDEDIEKICKSCIYCLENRPLPPKCELTPWKIEEKPWNRVSMDFLGPINGKMLLLMVDAYSKWMEIFIMNTMTSAETEEKIKEAFARLGLPRSIVTDNAKQFVAENIQKFFKRNGIKHITSPPGFPMSNGAAENGVRTTKQNIKTRLSDPRNQSKSLSLIISEFSFSYRNTPHVATKETPSMLMFGRQIRTRMEILKENPLLEHQQENIDPECSTKTENHQKAQKRQIKNHGGRKRSFSRGERVLVTDYRTPNNRKWAKAVIEKKIGQTIYLCRLEQGNLVWKRHTNQIIRRPRESTRRGRSVDRGRQNTEFKNYKIIKSKYCYPEHTNKVNTPINSPNVSVLDQTPDSPLSSNPHPNFSEAPSESNSHNTSEFNSPHSFVDANSSFSDLDQTSKPTCSKFVTLSPDTEARAKVSRSGRRIRTPSWRKDYFCSDDDSN